ncbi:glycosyltransferase family 4 protein [Flavobacterium soli]|uniref:glycosyltransferase family 4 protein n=1 Tax=Flavobacterium soli TaxID=344881 RepID=UPI0003FF002C|nr:glycosyltransferase family 4 protein [Flavobacterium soli]
MDLKKKKIAVICNYELLPTRVGGMDYFFWEFDKQCKLQGFEIDWFFPNSSNHGEYSQLHIFSSTTLSLEHFFLNHLINVANDYTHVFTHFLELCTSFFSKVKQKSTATVIAVDHNPRPLDGYKGHKKIKKRVKGLLFSRYIDLFVGVSNYTVQELINDFGSQLKNKTMTLYNGIDIEDIQVRQDRNKRHPTFLTASHLRYSKGIQDLIDAVYLLPDSIKSEIRIDVYGDGPYRTGLEMQVKRLALEKCFQFMGSSPKLKSIYCHYDYMLQPTHMECFSLSILESLAANVPVVTTNVGGNEEAIANDENGFIFQPKNVEVLKDVLLSLWKGEMKIERNTRILIEEKFTINKMVSNYMQIIKK